MRPPYRCSHSKLVLQHREIERPALKAMPSEPLNFTVRTQAARFSRVFRNLISGQRSSINPRFTRVGARYTSSPA